MLSFQKRPLLNFGLCTQTITVYHLEKTSQMVYRVVINNTHFEYRRENRQDKIGGADSNNFLVVIPEASCRYISPKEYDGSDGTYTLASMDKIILGTGPYIANMNEWGTFIPAIYPGLVVVKQIAPKFMGSHLCHVEVS